MIKKFSKSNAFFKKVSKVIPYASQTFSKSFYQYIKGQAPLFANRAKGAEIWDIDGNRYIDMINGLLPVILGYQYKATDDAIKTQLKKGIIFSLPSPLEYELALLLKKHIPSAEMARFGKNGSDVTTGAIRLARAVTGRNMVAVCGYHGWHDWYIGSTARDLGVPNSTKAMTHKFEYNNIKSLETLFKKYPKKIAAVILEPENYEPPKDNFLKKVVDLAHKNGALAIFDEVITGFRWHLGGAQKYYGVTPDLSSFGKSMGNGMPISALVGKKKYMEKINDIFYSFTAGGEALSLAAAIATIKEMEKKPILKQVWQTGGFIQEGVKKLLEKHNLTDVIQIKGRPCWQVFSFHGANGFSDLEIKTYVQQEVLQSGFLWYGSHNMSYAHTIPQMKSLLKVYDKVFGSLRKLIDQKTLRKNIKGGLITNIFKVR